MIRAFDHTSFTVADVDAAVRFWTAALGFTAASVGLREGVFLGSVVGVPGARAKIAHLHGHGHHMEFVEYLEPAGAPTRPAPNDRLSAHVAFETDDIGAAVARVLEHGGSHLGRVTEVTTGPYKGAFAVYLRDPNGVIVEFYQPAKPAASSPGP
jgi:catechol 2,3-dioxygenase-like lactoylglutathione lyase family enzyme